MKTDTGTEWLPVYEALASEVRLKIIRLVAERPMNIKELAGELGLSSAILTMHIRKLEKAGIIASERTHCNGAVQKLCSLAADRLEIEFPKKRRTERKHYEISVPVGHYTDFQAVPTCGLATREKVIGFFDDPRYFLDPERVNAGILWFAQGFVEYGVPNYLLSDQEPDELEISFEIGSEAPGVNSNWPSDISFFINGVKAGQWTSPGDFGGVRGKYTPDWWSLGVSQYGLFKILRINREGAFMDGERISGTTIGELDIRRRYWTFRIAVTEDSEHVGGVTLLGKGFGNYNQDMVFKLYYT